MIQSVIKKDSVRLSGDPAARPHVAASESHSKGVRLVRVEHVVRLLELTCSCGEVSVVELDYAVDPEKT